MIAPPVERLRAWSHRRLLGEAVEGPLEALRRVGAVYSAHPSGPLSLLARSAPFTPASFGTLERERAALRLPAMRGSVFLLPRELAPAAFAATRLPEEGIAARLRALGLEVGTYEALKPRVLDAIREPLAPRELKEALGVGQEAVWAMRTMAREGLVLRVGWGDRVRSDGLRWVATEDWLGAPLDLPEPEAALGQLAEVYFKTFGPARISDFAWWAGVPRARAEAAVGLLELVEVEAGHRVPPELEGPYRETAPPDDTIDVLPKWDPYTMGYAPDGRGRLVDDAHLRFAYSTLGSKVGATSGDGRPLLLSGGRAVAAWEYRLAGRRIRVTVRPFAPGMLPARDRVERAFHPLARLFEGEVELSVEEG